MLFASKSRHLQMSVFNSQCDKERMKGMREFRYFFPPRAPPPSPRALPPHQISNSPNSNRVVELTYPPSRPLVCSKSFQPLLLVINSETAKNNYVEAEGEWGGWGGGVAGSQDVTNATNRKKKNPNRDPLVKNLNFTC